MSTLFDLLIFLFVALALFFSCEPEERRELFRDVQTGLEEVRQDWEAVKDTAPDSLSVDSLEVER